MLPPVAPVPGGGIPQSGAILVDGRWLPASRTLDCHRDSSAALVATRKSRRWALGVLFLPRLRWRD